MSCEVCDVRRIDREWQWTHERSGEIAICVDSMTMVFGDGRRRRMADPARSRRQTSIQTGEDDRVGRAKKGRGTSADGERNHSGTDSRSE